MWEEYLEITQKFNELEKNSENLTKVYREYGFIEDETQHEDAISGNEYDLLRAYKIKGNYKMVIVVSTKDKYRSFGNDEEPYRNLIEFWEDGKLVESKQYVYFK